MAKYFFSPSVTVLIILALVSLSSGLNVVDHEHLAKTGIHVSLTNVDAGQNLTKLQFIQRAINRGKHRLHMLNALIGGIMSKNAQNDDNIRAPVNTGDGEFLMRLSIGTPPRPFSAIMDTASDLTWTQCTPCTSCFKQQTPIFDPAESSSFSKLTCADKLCKVSGDLKCGKTNHDCEYSFSYGDDSSTEGFLAAETFTFGEQPQSVSVPNIGFGCGVNNQGIGLNQSAGLVGLGRGPLSFVSQLGSHQFSYCFTSIGNNKSGSLFVGSLPDSNVSNGAIKSTPLIKNPFLPSFYYISLEGITVGRTLLPIPKTLFELGKDGSGGLIVDSGTTFTMLQEDAFDMLAQAFAAQTRLPVSNSQTSGFDLCFELPPSKSNAKKIRNIKFPRLVFHFKGLDLKLPAENYMVTDTEMGLVCLAMGPTGSLSIFGNVQLQNMLVIHDLQKETMSFAPTKCDQL